ncbi:unnamed protein product [Vitrella brassicaformis CCMP3155]|uniref:Cation transporter n=1 Tax=Vitrella brassicaformis (strain CCMP3155) TaxID=1169540 RepID=A0A0G4EVH4_VITBC|nr:unnamed protein product [Vitrella brassicaformis CCMP3155]|eukprot:CEM02411.1 unnamed protein product [Vitrella brassicaformis CCMP3155]
MLVTYYRCHFLYFLLACAGASLLLLHIEAKHSGLTWVDSFFMCVSAMSGTGLAVVSLYRFTLASQLCIMLLLFTGGQTFMALPPLLLRRLWFRQAHSVEKVTFLSELCLWRPVRMKAQEQAAEQLREYRALGRLTVIIFCYLICSLVIGATLLYFLSQPTLRRNPLPVDPLLFACFTTVAAFNNAGLTLLSNNLVLFAKDRGVLLVICWLIVGGQTGIPFALRFILWALRGVTRNKQAREDLDFLWHHPRQCSTHLFPSYETALLLATWVTFTSGEFALFVLTNAVGKFPGFSKSDEWLVGFFQSVSTRTAGFNAVDIGQTSTGMLVVWVFMMFVAVYPFELTLRTSASIKLRQDAQRRSLVLEYAPVQVVSVAELAAAGDHQMLTPARRLMALCLKDTSIIYMCVLVITLADNQMLHHNQLFAVLFEVISAYGTVGLSISDTNLALSASLSTFSKLVLCFVMLLGRHRGLPSHFDSSVTRIDAPPPVGALKPGVFLGGVTGADEGTPLLRRRHTDTLTDRMRRDIGGFFQ